MTGVTRLRLPFVALVLSALAVLPGLGADRPVPKPDKALVYYVRTGRMSGAAGSIYLFADRTFVGVIPNGAYGYAWVDPGRRLFWTTWTKPTREIDLVPGETYYLDVWREISIVDAATGEALIEKVRDLVIPDDGDREKAAGYIAKKYDRAVETEGGKEKVAETPIAVAAPSEEDRASKVRVPAYTQGVLQFLETVTSEFTPAGTEVAFRVMRDVVVDGRVIVRGGTLVKGVTRQSSQAGAYGKAGVLEITVAALTAADGSLVPLVAQVVGSGKDTEDGSIAAAMGAGLLGGASVRGREAFYLAGQELKVWTRTEAWVPPVPDAAPADAPVASSAATPPDPVRLEGAGPDLVRFKPKKGFRPDPVTIVLAGDRRPLEVSLVAVDDFTLPAPLVASAPVRRSDGWQCTFDGWGFVRYLTIGHSTLPLPVTIAGRLDDGRPFTARVPIRYLIEE